MSETTRFLVTTITGFVLLALFGLSITNPPFVALDAAWQATLFLTGIGALGLTVRQGYVATQTAENYKAVVGDLWED